MKKFKCYAKHNQFKYEAPYMIVQAVNKESALSIFSGLTRLADFKNEYSLMAFEIKR